MKRNAPVSLEAIAAQFGRGVAALDQIRAAEIADALRVESAKGAVLARERERLRRKYGDNHPRTKELLSRAAASEAHRAALVLAHGHASKPVPDAGKGWTVDGFVRTPDGAPVEGVKVAVANAQGERDKDFAQASTDDSGYFRIKAEEIPDTAGNVYVRAFDRNGALESNENRIAPATGRTDRIEIVLERTGKGDTRPPVNTAQPASAKARAAKTAQAAPGAAKPVPTKKKKATKRKAGGKSTPRK